jgi:hypothetical protein
MAGTDTSQRQTMTMNNGVYYLDTTISETSQKAEPFSPVQPPEPTCKVNPRSNETPCVRGYNVFQANETYYVFFLYARKTTAQTYQIYVGQKFDIQGGFHAGRMKIPDKNLATHWNPKWPTPGVTADYSRVKKDGILTVNIDFAKVTELDPTDSGNLVNLCQPRTFCKFSSDGKQCVSAVANTDPLLTANPKLQGDISAACGTWAVKDLDCPKDGCFGFSFTLPADFKTGEYKRPDPTLFPTLATQFSSPAPAVAERPGGQCYYDPTKAPVGKPCPTSP